MGFVKEDKFIVLTNGFAKKSQKTPIREIKMAEQRKKIYLKEKMSDLKKYINDRKAASPDFAEGFDDGYDNFRIGIMLKQARLDAGMTQDQIALAIGTRKTAISRLENHVQDVKLSTVEKYAKALGRRVEIKIA